MRNFFKLSVSISLPLLVFLIATIFFPLSSSYREINGSCSGLVVFIDPGHGGYDPGTSYDSVLEKDINLNISTKMFEKMLNDGISSLIARTDEYDLSNTISRNHKMEDLKKRVEYINQSGANLLVSIHLNAIADQSVYGPMVYYKDGDQSSKQLAISIQNKLNDMTKLTKIIHAENYYLFKNTNIPAVLVECGFLSNFEERQKLLDDTYQNNLAIAIYSGIKDYWLSIQ